MSESDRDPSSLPLRDLPPLVVKQKETTNLMTEISRLTPEASKFIKDEISKQVGAHVEALLSQMENRYITQTELLGVSVCFLISIASALLSIYFASVGNETTSLLLVWPSATGVFGGGILLYATTRSDLLD